MDLIKVVVVDPSAWALMSSTTMHGVSDWILSLVSHTIGTEKMDTRLGGSWLFFGTRSDERYSEMPLLFI